MPPHNFPYWSGNHHYFRSFHPYHGPRRFMFFSRLFWFGLGAGAYSAWSRHREREQYMIAASGGTGGPGEHNGEWKRWSGHHFGCHRQRFEQPPVQGQSAASPPSQAAQPVVPTTVPAVVPPPFAPATAPPQPPAPAYSTNEPTSPPADWQTERMREIGKQASDAMAEMSENALDNLMTNIQALKVKIAKAREEREKERIYFEQHLSSSDPSSRKDKQDRLI